MSEIEKQLRQRLEEVEAELHVATSRAEHAEAYLEAAEKMCDRLEAGREKIIEVIERLARPGFLGDSELGDLVKRCRKIMAEIAADS